MLAEMEKIIKEYVNKLSEDPRIQGVFVFGSHGTGTAHSYSDVDLYVVHEGYIDLVDYIDVDGVYIHHQWRTVEEYLEKSKKHTRTKPLGYSALVFYDKNGMIVNCLEGTKTQVVPKKIPKETLEMYHRSIVCDLKGFYGLKEINPIGCFIELNEMILMIVDLLYDKNGWWQVTKKHRVGDLKQWDLVLGDWVEEMILSHDLDWKLKQTEVLYDKLRKEA